MTSRLDEIFAPDRLRGRWSGEVEAEERAVAPEQPPPPPSHPRALAARLAELTKKRFAGTGNPALPELVRTLQEKVARRFPAEPQAALPPEEQSALEAEIEGLVDQIEDLAEALELGVV